MTEIFLPLWLVAAAFFIVALAYASVGLAGGSSYAALMIIFAFSSAVIPNMSLLLNLIVSSIGSFNFVRRGHLNPRLFLPFVVLSLPMAWVGGALTVPEWVFRLLLLLSLVLVLLRIYGWRETAIRVNFSRWQAVSVSLAAGGVMGLLAGITGIGGGIFLVPMILILGLGSMKQAAACGVVFIWLNSLAGLISRSQYNFVDFSAYWPLIAAVAVGGLVGSLIGSSRIDSRQLEKVLGVVVAVAAVILGRSLFPF
jgi:uncharacterized membrane protein YfcA